MLFGQTDAAPAVHAACLHVLNMAQSNCGSWGGKKDVEKQGGYFPPILHSISYNFNVFEVKNKINIKI